MNGPSVNIAGEGLFVCSALRLLEEEAELQVAELAEMGRTCGDPAQHELFCRPASQSHADHVLHLLCGHQQVLAGQVLRKS